MINRQDILDKTCYGLNIYSHVIRLGYKVEDGLRVRFPDCGCWPNPFDGYKETLHITIVKTHPENEITNYLALHHDESGHIPDGNAIDFARQFYGLQNQDLLRRINEDLHLRIGEKFDFYAKPEKPNVTVTQSPVINETSVETSPSEEIITEQPTESLPTFSFFRKPVFNKTPYKEITIPQVFQYITGEYARKATETLRSITDEDAARKFKSANFDYITPAGTFTQRKADSLKKTSGLIVIDIDDLETAEEVEFTFNLLLKIPRIETELLFRSPSAHGLKWIIPILNNDGHTHEFYFNAVSNYLKGFGIIADQSGRDVSRACFLPFDSKAFINPKYVKQ